MSKYVPIEFRITACNCPFCGAYAQVSWFNLFKQLKNTAHAIIPVQKYSLSECHHCAEYSVWLNDQMVYPLSGNVPRPNADLPDSVKTDYMEASSILNLSPRGAAALLRLAIQKLCKELGEKGDNINADIKNLVAKGLPPVMQQALDSVRVIGNNAVHPGQIDFTDDTATAHKLFGFVNIIADTLITQPKQIAEFYTAVIPENDKAAIQRRDGKV